MNPEDICLGGSLPVFDRNAPVSNKGVAVQEISSVSVVSLRSDIDATGKEVSWFLFQVQTSVVNWKVEKRFSDCFIFNDAIGRLKLKLYARDIDRPYPSFPTKYNLFLGASKFLEKRRVALDDYFNKTLAFVQCLYTSSCISLKPYLNATNAAALMLIDFLQKTSQTHYATCGELTTSSNSSPKRYTRIFSMLTSVSHAKPEIDDVPGAYNQPQVRVVEEVNRLCALLYVSGVVLSSMFVEPGTEPREVFIGGVWSSIFSAEDIPEEAPSNSTVLPAIVGRKLVFDSLPHGPFEVLIEVPDRFSREIFSVVLKNGVLSVTWESAADVGDASR